MGKLLKTGIWCTVVFLMILLCLNVRADEDALPKIASWEDGHGYQEDGTEITDSWAYDLVNPAGRYVLFDADGEVLQKTDHKESADLSSDYSGTETDPAILVIRSEIPEEFQGTIHVLLEEQSGMQTETDLTEENFYAWNLPVQSGDYTVKDVVASDTSGTYKTEYSPSVLHLVEQHIAILSIQVTGDIEAIAETEQGTAIEDTEEITDIEADTSKDEINLMQSESIQGKEDIVVQEKETRKIPFLIFGIAAVCLISLYLLHSKR